MSVVRSGETGWKPLQQSGVVIKVLRSDKATGASTFLLRFDAGARFPLHDHPGGEEVFVVEGDLRVGADRLTAGDYLYTPPSGKHAVASEGGCVLLVSTPIVYGDRFLGMIGSVVDLQFLIRRLQEVNRAGLMPFVVDSQGRLVAAASIGFATGQDMTSSDIVRSFVDDGAKAQLAATREFAVRDGANKTEMLGTYSPVSALDWAVVVQKPQDEAYSSIYEMQRTGRLLALLAVFCACSASDFACSIFGFTCCSIPPIMFLKSLYFCIPRKLSTISTIATGKATKNPNNFAHP